MIQPDITYSGGFLETKKIAALAETYYVSVAPTIVTARLRP